MSTRMRDAYRLLRAVKIQVIACFDAWRPLLATIGAGSAVGVAGMKEASDELADLMMSHGGAASSRDGEEHLIRSDRANSTTGFKGVQTLSHGGRYTATCKTPPCRNNYLGIFGIPEEAAQAYLQHQEKQHPEELEKEWARPVLLPIQEHLLIRSQHEARRQTC